MIKLSEYINSINADDEVPLNKPILILGKEHVITRWYNRSTYNVAVAGLVIHEIITDDKNLTYGMLYNSLCVKINNKTLTIGDILYDDVMGRYYIISRVDFSNITLIALHNGNNFSDDINVKDVHKITYDDICRLIGSHNIKDFNYVGNAKYILMVNPC